jgi:hypothetical protein
MNPAWGGYVPDLTTIVSFAPVSVATFAKSQGVASEQSAELGPVGDTYRVAADAAGARASAAAIVAAAT